jgi:FlaA1/EpsC-like NDP-sugar epimerase
MSMVAEGIRDGLMEKVAPTELRTEKSGTFMAFELPKLLRHSKGARLILMMLVDSAVFTLALVGAYLLRFDFALAPQYLDQIETVLPCLLACKLLLFYFFGLYRGMWRYVGMRDFWRLAQASLMAMLVAAFLMLSVFYLRGIPRSIIVLDTVLAFVLAGGVRILIRSCWVVKQNGNAPSLFSLPRLTCRSAPCKQILIIGAGGSGEKLLREIFDNKQVPYEVVGFLDDDPSKWGRALHGVPIFGPAEQLRDVVKAKKIDQVFISIPSATGAEVRRINEICEKSGVSYKILPAIGQILNEKISIKALRDVRYEDLLRRPPVRLDAHGIEQYLKGQKILVTGAGGSIGSELCRQLIRFNPGEMVLVDAGEANLYGIHMELKHEHDFHNYHCVLSRVQDQPLMDDIFKNYRPDVVFHAAAYKHVPMIERNPWEAVFNNVLGSRVVMELADKYGAGRFVLVSTDKAVRPTNVMGTTKRLTELILLSFKGSATRFMAVRFGNVLASSGSVIPLFRRQIEQGGPVTVTHPEVTRYFMTIPEAAQLILQAGALGEGGEIFVLEMGTPVKIADMARDLIRLSGKEPGRDVEVIFTGLRPGEKLYEELITRGEDILRTAHEKIMVLETNGRWNWNGMKTQEEYSRWLNSHLEELYRTADSHDPCAIKQKLHDLVPEYTPQETECVLKSPLGFRPQPLNGGNGTAKPIGTGGNKIP